MLAISLGSGQNLGFIYNCKIWVLFTIVILVGLSKKIATGFVMWSFVSSSHEDYHMSMHHDDITWALLKFVSIFQRIWALALVLLHDDVTYRTYKECFFIVNSSGLLDKRKSF